MPVGGGQRRERGVVKGQVEVELLHPGVKHVLKFLRQQEPRLSRQRPERERQHAEGTHPLGASHPRLPVSWWSKLDTTVVACTFT